MYLQWIVDELEGVTMSVLTLLTCLASGPASLRTLAPRWRFSTGFTHTKNTGIPLSTYRVISWFPYTAW